MRSQIYLPEMAKNHLKSQITQLGRVLTERILPVFSNLEQESDLHADAYFESFMRQPATEEHLIDPATIAEQALEEGLAHYEYLRLARYNVVSSWHVTLSESFEQQVRLLLFKEMRHLFKLDLKAFCRNMKEIREIFIFHNLDIEELACWPSIKELKLVCNVVKHGEGESAEALRRLNPSMFKRAGDIDLFELYKTTILAETLSLDETTFNRYLQSVLAFWDELPERSYSNEL